MQQTHHKMHLKLALCFVSINVLFGCFVLYSSLTLPALVAIVSQL